MVIYPGTFDPVTNGHTDVIEKAQKIFGKVTVAVFTSSGTSKKPLFSITERVEMVRDSFSGNDKVMVEGFDCLVTDFARERNVSVLIRGLRAVSDFDYEVQLAHINRRLLQGMETVFVVPDENVSFISSSLVKQVFSLGGDVTSFVPRNVHEKLHKKLTD